MASNLAVNDVIRMRVCCYTPQQISMNILHFKIAAIVGTFTDQDFANQADIAIRAAYKGIMAPAASYRGVGVSRLQPNPTSEVIQVGSAGAGTTGTELLPLQMSGIVGFYDGTRGRAHRGRAFIGFVSQNYLASDGTPTNTFLNSTLPNLMATFSPSLVMVSGLNGATATHSLYHRGLVPFTTAVTLLKYPPKFAGQHRRGSYGKPNVLPF